MADTFLVIAGAFPPYSTRGAKQNYEPIDAIKQQRRTVNGALRNLSPDQFKKYTTSIKCEDRSTPAFGSRWPGMVITVDWIEEFSYLTSEGEPEREVVDGSERTDGDYTFYRPRMVMMIKNFKVDTDEWEAVVGWSLDLEEV